MKCTITPKTLTVHGLTALFLVFVAASARGQGRTNTIVAAQVQQEWVAGSDGSVITPSLSP